MRNYNAGDKFVIEIEEVFNNTFSEKTALHRIKGFNSLAFDKNDLDRLERLDGDYVNENFGELQDEAYGAGRNFGINEALNWQKGNEEDAYNKGLNDAWELARRIALLNGDNIFSDNELKTIFGTTEYDAVLKIPVKEALAKFEAYEKEHAEIKVGDVVFCFADCDESRENEENYGVVTGIYDTNYQVLMKNGDCVGFKKSVCEKTGKHIDISAILAEIGKE